VTWVGLILKISAYRKREKYYSDSIECNSAVVLPLILCVRH
jgi:hypothetical protein